MYFCRNIRCFNSGTSWCCCQSCSVNELHFSSLPICNNTVLFSRHSKTLKSFMLISSFFKTNNGHFTAEKLAQRKICKRDLFIINGFVFNTCKIFGNDSSSYRVPLIMSLCLLVWSLTYDSFGKVIFSCGIFYKNFSLQCCFHCLSFLRFHFGFFSFWVF